MVVGAFFWAHCPRDRGCSAPPVFPAPSVFRGGRNLMKTSGGPRREKANARLERRHCEERSDEAIHSFFAWRDGLLPPSLFELRRTSRCARNDLDKAMPPPAIIARLDRAILVARSRLRQR